MPCHPAGVPVEAELGKVGGKEDSLDGGSGNPYTDPSEAKLFVSATGVDFLAVAIGTAHGVYKGVPHIDLERLSEIRSVVDIPLVLHGTSGVPDETVRECIRRGICKVNYATDLRIAFTKAVCQVLQTHPETIDPKKYGAAGGRPRSNTSWVKSRCAAARTGIITPQFINCLRIFSMLITWMIPAEKAVSLIDFPVRT